MASRQQQVPVEYEGDDAEHHDEGNHRKDDIEFVGEVLDVGSLATELHAEAEDHLIHGEQHQHDEYPAEDYRVDPLQLLYLIPDLLGDVLLQLQAVSALQESDDDHADQQGEDDEVHEVVVGEELLLEGKSD